MLLFSCSTSRVSPVVSGGEDTPKEEQPEDVYVSTVPYGHIKLMSFNIRYDNKDDEKKGHGWSTRKKGVYAMLKEERPLVFGVQECEPVQRQDLSENTVYDMIGVGKYDGEEKGESVSIFYVKDSIEIVKWGTFWQSETPSVPGSVGWDASETRPCTWALMRHRTLNVSFYYFNTHLDNGGRKARQSGLQLILKTMQEMNTEGYPCFLTADFNSAQDDSIFDELLTVMSNARTAAPVTDNYSSINNFSAVSTGGRSIDHIFFSGVGICRFCTVTSPWEGVKFISDHFPIWAEFDLVP